MTASTEFSSQKAALLVSPPAAAAVASFPVVFFDGDRETDVGTVLIDGNLQFKKLQSTICQKIGGVNPHQITLSLVRRKKARSSPEIRRKITIDEGSDFAAIARERDCFVLAVLRRQRRGRARRSHVDGRSGEESAILTPEKTILRRPSPELFARVQAAEDANGYGLGLGLWDYDALVNLQNLQIQRERYLMSTAAAASPYHPYLEKTPDVYVRDAALLGSYRGGGAELGGRGGTLVCKVCMSATERWPSFHWCVYDAVTFGFRSNVGPIQRPTKGHGQDSATA